MAEARGLVWPTRARLVLYLRLLAALTVLFAVVYGSCNWLTLRRGGGMLLHAHWELGLPFVPAMIYVYLSIGALFLLPLFCLNEHELRALAWAFAAATLAAGATFLLVPAELGHERPARVPGHDPVFRALYAMDLAYNLVPSLHIAYSTLIVRVVAGICSGRTAWIVHAWLVMMAVAVVLVRQHHLLDVATGLALGWACQILYQRRLRRALP